MIDRMRSLVISVTGAALLISGLGLASVGLAGMANADVCTDYYSDGSAFYYYC